MSRQYRICLNPIFQLLIALLVTVFFMRTSLGFSEYTQIDVPNKICLERTIPHIRITKEKHPCPVLKKTTRILRCETNVNPSY